MPRLSRCLFGLFAAIWLGAPFAARHPIFETFEDRPGPTKLEMWITELDASLPEDVEVALWWPERHAEGLVTLGHLWALGGYTLTPRRVYPLLTPQEAENVEPLDEKIRPFLVDRARALTEGEIDRPIVVLTWGDEDCFLEAFPHLVETARRASGCVLEPSSRISATTERGTIRDGAGDGNGEETGDPTS